ncbi:S4 domain-containing protein, partial [Bacillus cereus group sp. Bce020]|uniref:S4 domain-containing protein n=1 Tax=Bacillus cereus group sp. Bce020 TaxID=3445246 RepID=UPI003F6A4570
RRLRLSIATPRAVDCRRARSRPRLFPGGCFVFAPLFVMRLAQVLFSQGFGTRRECEALILAGEVRLGGQVCDDPDREVDPAGLCFEV